MKRANLYLYILSLMLGGSIFYIAHLKTTVQYLETSLQSSNAELQVTTLTIDSLKYTLSSKQGELVDMGKLLKVESTLKKKYQALYLQSLQSVTTLQSEIRVLKDSLQVLPDSVIITVYEKDTNFKALKLPFSWEYNDQYVTLKSGINSSAQPHFDLKMVLDGEVLVGYNKKGPIGAFVTTNPYITITNLNVKVEAAKPKWYESKWFYFGMGFGVNTLLLTLFK